MVLLTEQRQYLLGLGMMVADRRNGLSPEIREAGVSLLVSLKYVPPSWRQLIRTYLAQRIGARKALLLRQWHMTMAQELAQQNEEKHHATD